MSSCVLDRIVALTNLDWVIYANERLWKSKLGYRMHYHIQVNGVTCVLGPILETRRR